MPGGFVVTATHCIKWDPRGGMALGDHFLEPIETNSGAHFRLKPYFADPISDIAVLGEPDNQELPEDADAFEQWREHTDPIPLAVVSLDAGYNLPVHVFAYKDEWIRATLEWYGMPGALPNGRILMKAKRPIVGGTSGSPVVDHGGRLVGVVSQAGGAVSQPTYDGPMPIARLALPAWVIAQIDAATKKSGRGRLRHSQESAPIALKRLRANKAI